MVERERKEVRISIQFDSDIREVYLYGIELFGSIAAKSFIADIYSRIWSLDEMFKLHPESRFLITKDKRYRNIILGSYLIIYRVNLTTVDVLRIIHAHSSISKIRKARKVRT
jgi:plasmid stabilization system protein ParE